MPHPPWLALRAPALYIDSDWDAPKLQLHRSQDLIAYRHSRVLPADNKALAACQSFEGDVLLIESQHDDIVPQTVLSSYREACTQSRSLTYRCLSGADHGLTAECDQRAYTGVLVKWLGEMMVDARGAAPWQRSEVPAPATLPETPPRSI